MGRSEGEFACRNCQGCLEEVIQAVRRAEPKFPIYHNKENPTAPDCCAVGKNTHECVSEGYKLKNDKYVCAYCAYLCAGRVWQRTERNRNAPGAGESRSRSVSHSRSRS